MNNKKPISKRVRFEIFKRDLFTCQYCGAVPPKVVLECDHIKPRSKGGSNDSDNLITSCFDCNRGKSNIELERVSMSITDKHALLIERDTQLKEYQKLVRKFENRLRRQEKEIDKIYSEAFTYWNMKETFMQSSVRQFINELGVPEVKDAMIVACNRIHDEQEVLKYFCGICWAKIREL